MQSFGCTVIHGRPSRPHLAHCVSCTAAFTAACSVWERAYSHCVPSRTERRPVDVQGSCRARARRPFARASALPYHHPVRCPNLPKLHFWLTGSSLRWWLRSLTPRFLSLFYLRCLLLKACSPGWCGHQGHCRWHAHVAGFSKFPREFLLHRFTYPPLRWSFFQMASKSRRRHTSVSSSDPPRCLSLRECSRCLLRNMPSVTCDRLATSCPLALNTFFRRWNTCSRCHVCDWGSGYWPAPRKPLF